MTLLIIFICIAVGVSFICSLLEAALLSVSPAYSTSLVDQRPALAKTLAELLDNIDRPLSAILSLNTVAHTVGATGAGAQAAAVFGSQWIGVFSAVLTLAILVLSEIIPKTLGAVYWRSLTPLVVRVLPWLIKITLPLVWLSSGITWLIQKEKPKKIQRQEIKALADVGLAEGALDENESNLLKSLLKFRDIKIAQVMTPLDVVTTLNDSLMISQAAAESLSFSRIPLVHNDDAKVFGGYILKSELLEHASSEAADQPVMNLKRDLMSIPDSVKLPFAINRFIDNHEHIAMVVNDSGYAVGVITMEDVIETLMDVEIVDESDPVVDMRTLAENP